MDVYSSSCITLSPVLTASQGFYIYSYGTAGWLSLQAIPLIIAPTLISTLLSAEVHQPNRIFPSQKHDLPY